MVPAAMFINSTNISWKSGLLLGSYLAISQGMFGVVRRVGAWCALV